MYHGTVSVPHNKLQTFLKTAVALKIKGIVDTGGMEGRQWAGQDQTSPAPPGPVSQVGELVTAGPAPVHLAGDLSLLATAATAPTSTGPPTAPGILARRTLRRGPRRMRRRTRATGAGTST